MINATRFKDVRWDAMRDAAVAGRDPEIVVTSGALEVLAGGPVASEDAPALVAEEADRLARMARATPADDGTITLTARVAASRSWEVESHDE